MRVWDLRRGTCRRVFSGHKAWASSVALAPAGDKIVTTSGAPAALVLLERAQAACCAASGAANSMRCIHQCLLSASPRRLLLLPLSPCPAGDGTAMAYSLEGGDLLCLLEGHSGAVLDAVVTRKGRCGLQLARRPPLLLLEDAPAPRRSVACCPPFFALPPRPPPAPATPCPFLHRRFAVTVSDDATVRVWDFAARLVQPPSYHDGRVYCMAGSGAASVLATCGEDCDARLWDTERGTFRVRAGGAWVSWAPCCCMLQRCLGPLPRRPPQALVLFCTSLDPPCSPSQPAFPALPGPPSPLPCRACCTATRCPSAGPPSPRTAASW